MRHAKALQVHGDLPSRSIGNYSNARQENPEVLGDKNQYMSLLSSQMMIPVQILATGIYGQREISNRWLESEGGVSPLLQAILS